jgi:hypothetical protein
MISAFGELPSHFFRYRLDKSAHPKVFSGNTDYNKQLHDVAQAFFIVFQCVMVLFFLGIILA